MKYLVIVLQNIDTVYKINIWLQNSSPTVQLKENSTMALLKKNLIKKIPYEERSLK
jgi:hypothetical protein